MRKAIAATAMTAAVFGGAAGGAALFVPGLAGADDTSTSTTAVANSDRPEQPPWVVDALKKLVDDKTLTQAQADAVQKALQDARPKFDGHGPHGFRGGPDEVMAAAAKAIGVDESELRDALQSGKSIADVAASHNVDKTKVVDAMVASLETHVAQGVKDGHLTQAQADKITVDAKTRLTDLVDGKRPSGDGEGPRGPRGLGGPPRGFGGPPPGFERQDTPA